MGVYRNIELPDTLEDRRTLLGKLNDVIIKQKGSDKLIQGRPLVFKGCFVTYCLITCDDSEGITSFGNMHYEDIEQLMAREDSGNVDYFGETIKRKAG